MYRGIARIFGTLTYNVVIQMRAQFDCQTPTSTFGSLPRASRCRWQSQFKGGEHKTMEVIYNIRSRQDAGTALPRFCDAIASNRGGVIEQCSILQPCDKCIHTVRCYECCRYSRCQAIRCYSRMQYI